MKWCCCPTLLLLALLTGPPWPHLTSAQLKPRARARNLKDHVITAKLGGGGQVVVAKGSAITVTNERDSDGKASGESGGVPDASTGNAPADGVNSTELDIDEVEDAVLVGPAAYDQSTPADVDASEEGEESSLNSTDIDPLASEGDNETDEGDNEDSDIDTTQVEEDVAGSNPDDAGAAVPPAASNESNSDSNEASDDEVTVTTSSEDEEAVLVDMPMIGGQNKSTHPMQPPPPVEPGQSVNCSDVTAGAGRDNSSGNAADGSMVNCDDAMAGRPTQPTPSPTPTAFANRYQHNSKTPTHHHGNVISRNKDPTSSQGGAGKVGAGIGVAPKSTISQEEKEDAAAGAALMAVAVVTVLAVVLLAIRRRRSFEERGIQMSQVVSDGDLHLDVGASSGAVLGHDLDSSVGGGDATSARGLRSSRKSGRGRMQRGGMDISGNVDTEGGGGGMAYAPPAKGGVARGPYESYNELI
mmetsp:Transcript_31516/g.64111  ORF Transcript_31516/g.64111 Transcript_31516/m.64111 type:complete len:470 (+) Transcript_31516:119-1528(+)